LSAHPVNVIAVAANSDNNRLFFMIFPL